MRNGGADDDISPYISSKLSEKNWKRLIDKLKIETKEAILTELMACSDTRSHRSGTSHSNSQIET